MDADVRRSIDAYLDAVEAALLKAGAARAQRQAIVRDLETQLADMLSERCAGREPTDADVAALLAGMDAPDAYAQNPVRIPPVFVRGTPRRLPAEVLWGMLLMPIGWIGLLIVVAACNQLRNHSDDLLLLLIAAAPVILMIAMTSVLGWSAWRRIGRERSRLWGRPFALIEMLSFPLLVLAASPLLFFAGLFMTIVLIAMHRLYHLPEVLRRTLPAS
jgi:hypothetical protein